jgi:hypothetical protein
MKGVNYMQFYYFNDNTDEHGRHEVHTEECTFCPSIANRTYIGYFDNCKDAIQAVKREHPYKDFDGCYFCCHSCHNG